MRILTRALRRVIPIALLAACFTAFPAASKRSYKNWLNQDVVWIIGSDEKKAFKKFGSDEEREAFIEQFWKDRDPSPGTVKNEFKEEHYRRIKYANEIFVKEPKPGWKIERERVLIIHGLPYSRKQFAGREEWVYSANPYGQYYRGAATLIFELGAGIETFHDPTFQRRPPGSQTTISSVGRGFSSTYRLTEVIPRGGGSGTGSQYISDYLRSSGDWLDEKKRIRARGREKLRKVREKVRARVSFDAPLQLTANHWVVRVDEEVAILFALQVPKDQVAPVTDGSSNSQGRVDILCELSQPGSDYIIDSYEGTLDFTAQQPGGREPQVLEWFRVPAGDYQLFCLAREDSTGRIGQKRMEVKSSALEKGLRLAMSDPVLTQTTRTTKSDDPFPFTFQGISLVPSATSEFRRDQAVIVYFEVYNLLASKYAPSGLVFDYKIYHGSRVHYRSPMRPLDSDDRDEDRLAYALRLDLSALPAGDYSILLKVIHPERKISILKKIDFRLAN